LAGDISESGKKIISCKGAKTPSYDGESNWDSYCRCGDSVHRELGPGLLESVYEVVLTYELEQRGLSVRRQMPIPIQYKNMIFDEAFRADIVVDEKVIVELKSVERVSDAHKKQVQTYLRLRGCKLGFLLNFGEALMKRGITRVVNGLKDE
jgi:GxxExxY protein